MSDTPSSGAPSGDTLSDIQEEDEAFFTFIDVVYICLPVVYICFFIAIGLLYM